MLTWFRQLTLALVCAACCTAAPCAMAETPAAAGGPSTEAVEFFEKEVRPILAARCFECHGEQRQRGGLRLDGRDFVLKGTDNGPAAVAEKPEESLLVDAIRYDGDLKMPPQGKLEEKEIAALTKWVELGLPWPAARPQAGDSAAAQDWKSHWAFQPIVRHAPPPVRNSAWIRTPVDAFILAKLEEQGLEPSPAADRRTRLRRLSVDLIGLPPTAAELHEFVNDPAPEDQAWDRVVERLLGSQHYGERWGRYWLDAARYSDTKGYVFTEDRTYKNAYKFRDWVIQALNDDMPYDRFLRLQLAADLYADQGGPDALAALGFLTLGRRFLNNQNDIIDDRIDVLMRGTMGLTVSCARCHDHKYDPLTQKDYYGLYGVFASTKEVQDDEHPLRLEEGNPHNVQVFLRGNPGNRGDIAPRRFPQFCSDLSQVAPEPFQQGSGRKELAEAITDPRNPLTARVIVNRVWGYHFGQPLVTTPSDFGLRSSPPSHPELLDYLAGWLIDNGWSLKGLHRLIVRSAVYQQSSAPRPEAAAVDPENRLLARMNRRRLDFEAMRDALLFAGGELDPTCLGPSVDVTRPPFSTRRTVYAHIDRQNLPGLFRAFDFASPDTHSPQRYQTTVPQQALFLMNSPFLLERAKAVSTWEAAEAMSDEERIERIYQRVLLRSPTAEEKALARAFVAEEPPRRETAPGPAWQYGFGSFDEAAGRVEFTPFSQWTGSAWQAGAALPDPERGWVMLTANGGHPGTDPAYLAIRRWIPHESGRLRVFGQLKHGSEQGNGVRARIVSPDVGAAAGSTEAGSQDAARAVVRGAWTAHNSGARTQPDEFEVRAGVPVDFIVDSVGDVAFDSFEWSVRLRLRLPDGREITSQSRNEFAGPAASPPDVWAQLAQVLLLSNEFAFVD